VIEFVQADWRDNEWGGGGLTVNRGGERARGNVSEHSRHDLPAKEISAVGVHRLPVARAANVSERFGWESDARALTEGVEGDWESGGAVFAALPVDLHLVIDAEPA
jgi:hypothetical protein